MKTKIVTIEKLLDAGLIKRDFEANVRMCITARELKKAGFIRENKNVNFFRCKRWMSH